VIRIGRDLDEQIASVELRIKARERRLAGVAELLRTAARHQLTSPSVLLFAVGAGFVVGRVTEGARAPGQSRLHRIWTSLSDSVRAALGVMQTPGLMWLARLFGRSAASTHTANVDEGPLSMRSVQDPAV
jgi:hypothetical protein